MKTFLTIKQLRELLDKKEIEPKDISSFYRKRIEKFNPKLNAILEVFEEESFKDEYLTTGRLSGIPGILKDNICQKKRITSCGSKILSNYRSSYDSTVSLCLKKEGGILFGRANMDEFAMGSSGEFSAFGATYNPWDLECVPGGSSSGPAAAVAAGLVPWAIGTETGGSVRQPAAFTGLVGLYPTYGLISRYGLVAFASSTDQAGALTKTVYDNALVTSVIAGHDPKDSTSVPGPKRDYTNNLNDNFPQGLTLGILRDAIESDGVDDEIKKVFSQAIEHLERMGAKIKYIDMQNLKYGISVYFVLSRAEATSNLARYDGTLYGFRAEGIKNLKEMYTKTRDYGFGDEVKRRILLGNYVLSAGHKDAYYTKAQKIRSMIRAEYDEAFKDVDLIVSPTNSTFPFKVGKESADPLSMYLNDYFTIPNCIIGLPALTLPCGYSKEGLPVGFQFTGPRLSEDLIYQVAYAYEQATQHYLRLPKNFE